MLRPGAEMGLGEGGRARRDRPASPGAVEEAFAPPPSSFVHTRDGLGPLLAVIVIVRCWLGSGMGLLGRFALRGRGAGDRLAL